MVDGYKYKYKFKYIPINQQEYRMKRYAFFMNEASKGPSTYSRKTKKNGKELKAILDSEFINAEYEPGYNAEWISTPQTAKGMSAYVYEKLDLYEMKAGKRGKKFGTYNTAKELYVAYDKQMYR